MILVLTLFIIFALLLLIIKQLKLLVETHKYDLRAFLAPIWKAIKDYKTFISFLLAWMITNGWSYILIGMGIVLHINWMWRIGTGYLAFLWLPCTPEKVITIPLAVVIRRSIFKDKEELIKEET